MEVERPSGGRNFMDEDREGVTNNDKKRVDDRNRRLDDHSSAVSEKLLQGSTLRNEHCTRCLTPLVRNGPKKMLCAACTEAILAKADAAARALRRRVDRSDLLGVLSQSGNSSSQHSAGSSTSSSPSAPAVTQSPAYEAAGGYSNGIGLDHLRSSPAPDSRNPKRFASSSDHVHQDSVPQQPPLDVKDSGDLNDIARSEVPTTTLSQCDADNPVSAQQGPSKPALVLQPTVNSVNDIPVAQRILTTLNEKLEGIYELISNSQDVIELRQLFAVLDDCIPAIQITRQFHAIQITRRLLKSDPGDVITPEERGGMAACV